MPASFAPPDRAHRSTPIPSARPHLVFLCQTLPYPVDSGVHIRSFHTFRLLCSEFDVTGLFFYRTATRATPEAVEEGLEGLRAVGRAQAFPIPQEHNRARLLWDHARSVARGRVYTAYAYESSQVKAELRRLHRERGIDILHLDSLDLAVYRDAIGDGVPTVCSHHNVESVLLRRRGELSTGGLRDAYLRHQANLMEREERRYLPRMPLNLVVSEPDRVLFERMVPDAPLMVVPNCVDTRRLRRPEGHHAEGVVFVGPYSWEPNRDAMLYFCRDILPRIRRQEPDCPVTWLARDAPAHVVSDVEGTYGIRVMGYVDDVVPWITGAACYAVPLRVGGGTRLKIVEAWALGSAVVSTSIGAEGLQTEDGENIILADDEGAFADAVVRILRDPVLRERVGGGARRTAEEAYDWDAQLPRLAEAYRALLPG